MNFFTFDEGYLERLRNGDRWTTEHFIGYFSPLLAIKLRRLRVYSIHEIDEMRQETLVRVIDAIYTGKVRQASRLGAFVLSVGRNVNRESVRRDNKTVNLSDRHEVVDETDVEQLFASTESAARVQRVLKELDPRDEFLLRAIFIEERDKDDICRELRVNREYLRVLVHRAKLKFRDLFRRR